MPVVLLGLAVLGGGLLVAWWYSRASAAQVAVAVKAVGIAALAGAALYLLFVGRAVIIGLLPVLLIAAWKLGPSALARWRAGREGRRYGRESGVRTPWLAMTLDHASGRAEGEVLQGRFSGRRLADLTRSEALALRDELAGHPQSAALLDAWLDREHEDWRTADAAPASGGPMTRAEALQVLDLEEGATPEQIKAAHHRLMLKLHPDHGGSTWMAAKLNQAKDLLLG